MNVPSKLIKGATGAMGGRDRPGGARAGHVATPSCSPAPRPQFGGEPNSNVSLVDAAMPGMLPVMNEECVKQAIRTGLGLKAQINHRSHLRPEELLLPGPAAGLPDQPVQGAPSWARARWWSTSSRAAARITVGIERLHLEQDAGKSLHDQHPTMSFVDLNRSGVALMEIVSKPDLRSSEEALAPM